LQYLSPSPAPAQNPLPRPPDVTQWTTEAGFALVLYPTDFMLSVKGLVLQWYFGYRPYRSPIAFTLILRYIILENIVIFCPRLQGTSRAKSTVFFTTGRDCGLNSYNIILRIHGGFCSKYYKFRCPRDARIRSNVFTAGQ